MWKLIKKSEYDKMIGDAELINNLEREVEKCRMAKNMRIPLTKFEVRSNGEWYVVMAHYRNWHEFFTHDGKRVATFTDIEIVLTGE